jgi:hypothetical protein
VIVVPNGNAPPAGRYDHCTRPVAADVPQTAIAFPAASIATSASLVLVPAAEIVSIGPNEPPAGRNAARIS